MSRTSAAAACLLLATACTQAEPERDDSHGQSSAHEGGAPSGAAPQADAGSTSGDAAAAALDGGQASADAAQGLPDAAQAPADAAQPSTDAAQGSDAAPPAAVLDERRTLIPDPSWSCGMPDGIPGPLTGQLAFTIEFDVAQVRDLGDTPYGQRRQLDIRAGTVSGAKAAGSVLPGGLEYELTLEGGGVEVEQIHVLRLGTELVFMRNCGVSPAAAVPARIVLGFEAANGGAYAFLNEGRFVATRAFDPGAQRARLEVYQLSGAADPAGAVRVSKPTSRPSQSWECKKSSAAAGAEVYQAAVDVETEWLSVGESKHGLRNIIPILGGSLTGKLKGRILPGGADYQIIVGDFALDARYTLQTDDGELILVRNCGALGSLVPTFETRRDGPYAWLNQGAFRCADPLPSLDLSQIFLTIYEAR